MNGKKDKLEVNYKFCKFCETEHNIDINIFHADFNSVLFNKKLIAIYDENKGNRSVTNDIEYVLFTIEETYRPLFYQEKYGLHNFKIIYRDSEGFWDRVNVDKDGKFIGFSPIIPGRNVDDLEEAIEAVSIQI